MGTALITDVTPMTSTLPLGSAEALVFLLFAAGVTAMTAVAFVLWLGYVAVRGLVMVLVKLSIWPVGGRDDSPAKSPNRACPDPVCRTINPTHAHFCRQCGRMLRAPRR